MKPQTLSNDHIGTTKRPGIWILFGVLLAALACSTAVGAQPKATLTTCTSNQCQGGYGYAFAQCHGTPAYFECPDSFGGELDDFAYSCDNVYFFDVDCGTGQPS